MSEFTKIQFSEAELLLMANSDFFLTKKKITEKIYTLFSDCANELEIFLNANRTKFPVALNSLRPKITRGEKYEDLPYIVLDYPAIFNADDIFALRTIYHWAHGFSLHFILKGKYKTDYERTLISNLKKSKKEISTCINDSLWEHHFREDNYIQLRDNTKILTTFEEKEFLKLGISFRQMPVNKAATKLLEECLDMLRLVID